MNNEQSNMVYSLSVLCHTALDFSNDPLYRQNVSAVLAGWASEALKLDAPILPFCNAIKEDDSTIARKEKENDNRQEASSI